MTRSTVKKVMWVGRATVFMVGLSLTFALVLGMALWAGPAQAQTCPPGEDCEPPNLSPSVRADSASVVVVQGQTATNTGTYSDDNVNDDVTITASVGNVTKTGTNSGTWNWSLANAPLGMQRVTITATDSAGASRTTAFTLTVTLPNGKIAFSSAADIYTMNPDGSGRTNLTNIDGLEIDPAFSPDGTRIAFVFRNSFGDLDIAVMNANGRGMRPLVQGPVRDEEPIFSPDGTKIAYSSNGDIYVINVDGSGQTNLTNSSAIFDGSPAFSPDGTRIAFTRGGDIYTMNPDGSNQTPLTNNSANSSDPAFSPDGTGIAFTRGGDIYVMNAAPESATNQPQRLTDVPESDSEPSWSPDGTKIAFMSNRDGRVDSNGFTVSEIYVMNADGSNQTRLTNNTITDASPSWGGASDTVPPETTITSGPSGPVNSNSAEFGFSSSEPNSVFECSLDGGPFGPCNSPRSYPNLAEGQHTFQVRATDVSDNTDQSPASRTWTVDTTTPETTIDSGPSGTVKSSSATFAFSSTEANAAFECRLTRQGDTPVTFTTCSSPKEYNDLTDGSYTFEVRAKDAAGNTDPTPASRAWTVDTVKPRVTGVSPANLATGVAPGTNLTATFSEAMKANTITRSTFQLFKVNSNGSMTQVTNVTVSLSSDGLKATLNPFGTSTTLLARNTRYRAMITTGAKDLAGNALDQKPSVSGDQGMIWSFTTR
jgi:dipeptidyl aminopeptidase/acylaminoacyl peptidase